MTSASTLEVLHCDGISPGSIDSWRQGCQDALYGDVYPVGPAKDFEGRLARRWVDDLLMTEMDSTPLVGRFSDRSASNEYVVLWQAAEAGTGESVVTGGKRVDTALRTGYADHAPITRYEFSERRTTRQLFIPKSALQRRGIRLDPQRASQELGETVAGRLLLSIMETLIAPQQISAAEAVAIRTATLDLLQGLNANEGLESNSAVSDSMRQRVEAWVVQGLLDGEVTPEAAARAQGISLRSLHRLFADTDHTFSGFVRSVRLERARNDLMTGALTVQSVASRWGYSDVSHFCREFKRVYGETTSQFRSQLVAA